MYIGRDYPDYIGFTPLSFHPDQLFAFVEANSGETIDAETTKLLFGDTLNWAHTQIVNIFQSAVRYDSVVNRIMELIKKYPKYFGEHPQHYVIEEETGLVVGFNVTIKDPENKVEIGISTAYAVDNQLDLLGSIYNTNELAMDMDSYTNVVNAITNAIKLIALGGFGNIPHAHVTQDELLKLRNKYDDIRWPSIETELKAGVAPLIVHRRWCILNGTGYANGTDETVPFEAMFKRIMEESDGSNK